MISIMDDHIRKELRQLVQAEVEENDVSVVPYNRDWPQQFTRESHHLRVILDDISTAIEHFGSTSVPDLWSKPIVDILVGTTNGSYLNPSHVHQLADLDYIFLGEDGRRPGRWFFRKRGEQSFNLSIVPFDSDLWRDNLLLRDYLRQHPDEKKKYGEVKLEGLSASGGSLIRYQNTKRAFVGEMVRRAREWGERDG